MRRLMATAAVLLCTAGAMTACGEDEPEAEGDGGTTTIELTIEDGVVTPAGERVEVGVGEPVELVIRSDEPDEVHVHSDPEQTYEYGTGTTTLKLDPIDKPGIVEVEAHELDQVLVQLEVS